MSNLDLQSDQQQTATSLREKMRRYLGNPDSEPNVNHSLKKILKLASMTISFFSEGEDLNDIVTLREQTSQKCLHIRQT